MSRQNADKSDCFALERKSRLMSSAQLLVSRMHSPDDKFNVGIGIIALPVTVSSKSNLLVVGRKTADFCVPAN